MIDVEAVLETRWFSKTDKRVRQDVIDAAAQGRTVPPIIVYRATDNAELFGLLDGVNRTFAYWLAGLPKIRAYEILTPPTT